LKEAQGTHHLVYNGASQLAAPGFEQHLSNGMEIG
jgi:hypothetical protein